MARCCERRLCACAFRLSEPAVGSESRNVSPGKEVALRGRVENCSVGVTRRIVAVSFMVRSEIEPEGRLRIDRDGPYRDPGSSFNGIMT